MINIVQIYFILFVESVFYHFTQSPSACEAVKTTGNYVLFLICSGLMQIKLFLNTKTKQGRCYFNFEVMTVGYCGSPRRRTRRETRGKQTKYTRHCLWVVFYFYFF